LTIFDFPFPIVLQKAFWQSNLLHGLAIFIFLFRQEIFTLQKIQILLI